jgi:hypothetical protein
MTSVQSPDLRTRSAHKPFYFNTSAHLLRIGRERAATLGELEEHHFIREGFSNDFAHLGILGMQ